MSQRTLSIGSALRCCFHDQAGLPELVSADRQCFQWSGFQWQVEFQPLLQTASQGSRRAPLQVAVVSDATAAAIVEEGDGYAAALVNFRFIANTVWTTREAVARMSEHKKAE